MASAQSVYSVGSWRVGDNPRIYFPVVAITDSQGNRLVEHERPYREGAKFDDTGGKARRWQLSVVFNNTINESGISDNGRPLFPDVLRLLQQSFDAHECGDLVVPGIGPVRARADTMTSHETNDEVDTARVDLVFAQDNEEALDRTLIRPPTARATTRTQAEQTTFTLQSVGVWGKQVSGGQGQLSLLEAANKLQDLMLTPGRTVNRVQQQAKSNRRDMDQLIARQREVNAQFGEPRGATSERQLLIMKDRQAQAAAERAASLPTTRPFTIDVANTTIFDVAARFNQDPQDLLELNDSRVADPFQLRRGDVILVYQSTPRA